MIADHAKLLDDCAFAAKAAADEILRLVAKGFEVEEKGDSSPVTICDRAAELIILDHLREAAPGVPVIAEEEVSAGHVTEHGDTFFLVDPLDGTKEFVRGGEDFSVNIGLIEGGVPKLGVIHQPKTGICWGGLVGEGAWREQHGHRTAIACRNPQDPPAIVASKSHFAQATADYMDSLGLPTDNRVSIGSSLKFCLLAEGKADIYPRVSPTMEWDTAAGHAILLAAGGKVWGVDGEPLAYDKPGYFNPGFCASGGMDLPPIAPFMGESKPR